jgi:hypothetical protein
MRQRNVVFTIALMTGCAAGDDSDDPVERSGEIVENLLEAGYLAENIDVREAPNMIGADGLQVFVDGDVHVTLAASREILDLDDGDGAFRQWRTSGLVNNYTTICMAKITAVTGGASSSYILTTAMRAGVDAARDNYNALSSFELTFVSGNGTLNGNTLTTSMTGCNSVIYYYQVSGGAGGSAGFPSGGAPYNQVQLNSGLAGYSADVHEMVATHETGHCIGMRLADWKTRSSCGQNLTEGQNGAVLISGTPDQTTDSFMRSCFTSSDNGEFRGYDTTALNAIY